MPQSKLDYVYLLEKKAKCILYVDDLLFWSKDDANVHDVAILLGQAGSDLEQEDHTAEHLCVRTE